jgi:hypothetical protein
MRGKAKLGESVFSIPSPTEGKRGRSQSDGKKKQVILFLSLVMISFLTIESVFLF